MTKLTNFIQAVYLPWSEDVEKFRPPLDVIAELETYMTKNLTMDQRNEIIEDETDVEECEQKEHMPRNIGSYINSHIRRTIGFALSAPDVKHDTKKMIQLLRHQFSRKRQKLFEGHNSTYDEEDSDILGEYAEVMCEAQADRLAPNKHKTRMEKHLDDVFNSLERLRDEDQKGFSESKDEYKKFTLEDARQLKNDVDKKIQDLADSKDSDDEEAEDDEAVYNMKYLGCIRVNEEAFYEDMSDDQKDAGRYLLTKLSKLTDHSQLLMLLHGSPGTGKSFLIKRLKNCTDVKMQITATSGICAMSLNGSTIDWLLDKGYKNKNNEEQRTLYTRVENMRGKLGDTTLLVIDEVSMMGCKKLNELDKMLKMVKNNELVFGGLDVLLVGDFAQLPAVKQVSLHDALVQSTQHYIAPKEDVMQAATLLARFRKFELTTLHRSEGCMKLKELLIRYRSIENSTSSITMDEIKEIGVLDKEVLTKNTKFKDAVMLVTTRREKSELSKKIGQRWAKDKGVPFYWWYKRPSKGGMSNEEADLISQGMYKYCPDVEGYYIQGAPCMMKRNISPPLGYANGSQGKMIGIVPKEGNVLPAGAPGEMIMIEPPEYIIMEVSHKKDKKQWTTIVPCKLEKVTFDYKRDGKDKKFYCMSNSVNLKFAFTIHETQGQTLEKVLLLLGRKPGLHVGSITWSLLYVALSRARELQDIKFFPCGWSGFSNFKHLTRLKPSSIFVKWNSGYRDNVWRSDILEKQNRRNEMCVENKLVRQGPALSLDKTNDILIGYLLGLGYKVLKKTHRKVLQTGVMGHMERKKLWKLGEDKAKFLSERGSRKRKKSQVKKIVQRKSRKLSDGKKSESVNLSQKLSSVKAKRKLSKKKLPANKKKSKKKVEMEEILPERFLYPDDLIFEKLLFDRKGYRIDPIIRDGNCLFRAIAGAVKGNTELYADVRKQCADFMEKGSKYFFSFSM
ncbi:MAG: AAA family ATPase, partial [Pseudomonadota bacterium]